jgi:hypothetical protein
MAWASVPAVARRAFRREAAEEGEEPAEVSTATRRTVNGTDERIWEVEREGKGEVVRLLPPQWLEAGAGDGKNGSEERRRDEEEGHRRKECRNEEWEVEE